MSPIRFIQIFGVFLAGLLLGAISRSVDTTRGQVEPELMKLNYGPFLQVIVKKEHIPEVASRYLATRYNEDNEVMGLILVRTNYFKKLGRIKVTAERAVPLVADACPKCRPVVGAPPEDECNFQLVSVVTLGRDVPGFAVEGDTIWIVRQYYDPRRGPTRGKGGYPITPGLKNEFWVNARSGHVIAMFPGEDKMDLRPDIQTLFKDVQKK